MELNIFLLISVISVTLCFRRHGHVYHPTSELDDDDDDGKNIIRHSIYRLNSSITYNHDMDNKYLLEKTRTLHITKTDKKNGIQTSQAQHTTSDLQDSGIKFGKYQGYKNVSKKYELLKPKTQAFNTKRNITTFTVKTNNNHNASQKVASTLNSQEQKNRRNYIVHTTIKDGTSHDTNIKKKSSVYVVNPVDTGGQIAEIDSSERVGDILSPMMPTYDSGDKKGEIAQNDGESFDGVMQNYGDSSEGGMTQVGGVKLNIASFLPEKSGNQMKLLDAAVLQTGLPVEVNYLKSGQQQEQQQQQLQQQNILAYKQTNTKADEDLTNLIANSDSTTDNIKSSFLKSTSVASDPNLSKAITADNLIDSTIKDAITAQIKSDNELSKGSKKITDVSGEVRSGKPNIPFDIGSMSKNFSTGDLASIADEADKTIMSKMAHRTKKLRHAHESFTPVEETVGGKKLLERLDDSLRGGEKTTGFSDTSKYFYKKENEDPGLEVNPSINSLSKSEQDLVNSIDKAVRKKDVATEIATKIMMPAKEDPFSDQTIAPSEQLLDMLSKGKFNEPLPDNVLTKLSMFDPNQSYLKEEAIPELESSKSSEKNLMQIGSQFLPVRSVAMKTSRVKPNPIVGAQDLARARQLMKTDPYYLAQNNNLLDARKFHSLDDLGQIGESIVLGNVLNLQQPAYLAASAQKKAITTLHSHPISHRHPLQHTAHFTPHFTPLQHPSLSHAIDPLVVNQINNLPTVNLKKLIEIHRKNQKVVKSFEDTISETHSDHNTVDKFEPETVVTIQEEHRHDRALCKWNPCFNGGTCTAHPDKFYCSCPSGWIGANCERRNNCFPNPCHYGTCSPNLDGYTCTCKMGYKGALCNILDRCHPNPCRNSGICTELAHNVQCECSSGFKGQLCELESKCAPINPCLNGGTCHEFFDHYHCSCPEGFRGENCEEFVNPTKPPPTIPLKNVGPQAIPAPINAPISEIHEVFTVHSIDNNGRPYSEIHEEVRHGHEGIVNPGGNLAPHPVAIGGLHEEIGNPFVGSPASEASNNFIIHSEDEKEPAKPPPVEKSSDLPDNTKDDRYQTHLVEMTKNKESPHNPNSLNVGKPVVTTSADYSPAKQMSLENPSPHDEENVDKVLAEHKEHNEEAKVHHPNDHDHHHDEMHDNEAHTSRIHGDAHHNTVDTSSDLIASPVSSSDTSAEVREKHEGRMTAETNAVTPFERSSVLATKKKEKISENKNDTETKGDKKTTLLSQDHSASKVAEIGKLLQTFDNVTKNLSDNLVKSTQLFKNGSKKDAMIESDDSAEARANLITQDHSQSQVKTIGKLLKNFDNVTKTLADKLTQNAHRVTGTKRDEEFLNQWTQAQKDAYTQWRRKALINYRMRNPDKPIPRNTLSLSKNSLCPKFCRFFCDPWCVKIGCCTLSVEKLNIYKQIEDEQEKLQSNPDTRKVSDNLSCQKCNENADCINNMCVCKAGFNGDGQTCQIDGCLLCHVDSDCVSDRCTCKPGFTGDGYDCKPTANKRDRLCGNCHRYADCNGKGCNCRRGFYGNGKQCWPLPIL